MQMTRPQPQTCPAGKEPNEAVQTNRPMPPFSVNLLDFYNSTMKTEEGLVVVSGEGCWIGNFKFRSAWFVQLDHEDGRGAGGGVRCACCQISGVSERGPSRLGCYAELVRHRHAHTCFLIAALCFCLLPCLQPRGIRMQRWAPAARRS